MRLMLVSNRNDRSKSFSEIGKKNICAFLEYVAT